MKRLLLLIGALIGISLITQTIKQNANNTAHVVASPTPTITQNAPTVTPTITATEIPTATPTPTITISKPSIAPVRNREDD